MASRAHTERSIVREKSVDNGIWTRDTKICLFSVAYIVFWMLYIDVWHAYKNMAAYRLSYHVTHELTALLSY